MEKIGTESIEGLLEVLKKLAIAGKKISADGKVDLQDLGVLISLLPELPAMLEKAKHLGKAIEEGKDIDVPEVVALIQKVAAMVKEVEAA